MKDAGDAIPGDFAYGLGGYNNHYEKNVIGRFMSLLSNENPHEQKRFYLIIHVIKLAEINEIMANDIFHLS